MKNQEEYFALTSMLDTAISTNRRKSIEPMMVLMEHYVAQCKKSREFQQPYLNQLDSELQNIKEAFQKNSPTAHIVFYIRDLIELLSGSNYLVEETAEKDHKKNKPIELFKDYLEKNEGRLTDTKKHIAEQVFKRNEHFEVENFIDDLRKKSKNISRATVYRTIKQLLAARLLQKITTNSGKVYYEHSTSQKEHAHLICNHCGKIYEIHDESINSMLQAYCEKEKFDIEYQSIHIYGKCGKNHQCGYHPIPV